MTGGPPGLAGAPPGLVAAPGLSPPANGAAAEGENLGLKQEIFTKISAQVQSLLLQAKQESEAKVKLELRELHMAMQELDNRLDTIIQCLDETEVAKGGISTTGEAPLEQATIVTTLANVEQNWGKELNKLKNELHQTIFAHNHNADLMKHQKEKLEQIRQEIDARNAPSPEKIKVAKAQLVKLDHINKASQKQRRLEPILGRMAALEQKVGALWRWSGGMSQASAAASAAALAKQAQVAQAAQALAASSMTNKARMLAEMTRRQTAMSMAQAGAFYGAAARGNGLDMAAYSGLGVEDDEEDSLEQVLARALAATTTPAGSTSV
eukprot:TRINITY_DN82538_c0_g1_i1.p1 TRINITY_DN82538_c0_g1~~TRINITY_DN82538_c0_g1_i1.p1  ORF type:complete len:324 (+),score=82.70 TRINITY_DN82538_c0_g1_i1:156-1127(+)